MYPRLKPTVTYDSFSLDEAHSHPLCVSVCTLCVFFVPGMSFGDLDLDHLQPLVALLLCERASRCLRFGQPSFDLDLVVL